MTNESKCPVLGGSHRHTAVGATANQHWWPNQLNLKVLNQDSPQCDPMGEEFNYAKEFKTLDLDALKRDIEEVMTTSPTAAGDAAATTVAKRLFCAVMDASTLARVIEAIEAPWPRRFVPTIRTSVPT